VAAPGRDPRGLAARARRHDGREPGPRGHLSRHPPTGIYSPRGLAARQPEKPLGEIELATAPTEALADVSALIIRPGCIGLEGAKRELDRAFQKTTTGGDVAVWVRR
jgi:hypothetical protein